MRTTARWAFCLIPVFPAMAMGQTPPGAAPPADSPPVQAPPGPAPGTAGPAPPERLEGSGSAVPGSGDSRGSGSRGPIIVPPNADPDIDKPPPSTGSQMPVIPPPGTPGSGSKLQPK
jgi:hypothetical protein